MVWPAAERNAARQTIQNRQSDADITKIPLTIIELTDQVLDKLSLDEVERLALLDDAATLARIVSELGIDGQVYPKTVNGRTYLIIKGYAGKRATITGTRYLITNPKIAHISVTPKQIVRGALKISIFQIVAYTAWNAIDAIFVQEDQQLATFLGKTTTDALKVAASASVAAIASMATAAAMGVSVLAVGPLIIGVVVAVAAGAVLDSIDTKYKLTERLIAATDRKLDELMRGPREFQRQWWRWERWFKDDPNAAMGAIFGR